MYTWAAAKRACPPGWRLPSDEEWRALAMGFGGLFDWSGGGRMNDPKISYQALLKGGDSGFAARLGGHRNTNGEFYYLGTLGLYWSGTEKDAQYAWSYDFSSIYGELGRDDLGKAWGFSCRCLKGS